VLGGPQEGEVEQKCLIAPLGDVRGRGVGLVRQGLAAGWSLSALKQEACGEDSLCLEARQVDWLDPRELCYGWHGSPFSTSQPSASRGHVECQICYTNV